MMFLAWRHLVSRRKQSLLILTGICVGTMVYVVIAGTQLGFRQFIVEQLVENDAHVKIRTQEESINTDDIKNSIFGKEKSVRWITPPSGVKDESYIQNPQAWYSKLESSREVAAYSPQFSTQVLVRRGGARLTASFVGVLPEKQLRVTRLGEYITQGRFQDLGSSGSRVVVGSGLLKKVGARLGDTLLLSTGSQAAKPHKIVGVFELGVQQLDDSFIYGALRDVQQLAGQSGRISQIAVKLFDVAEAQGVAMRLSLGSVDRVQSWDQANANFLQIFQIQDIFRAFITFGILIVVAFGIYNVLTIIVNQKKREIAILQSLGFPPRSILELFFYQGVILGVAGSLFGLIAGYGICVWLVNLDLNMMGRKGFLVSFDPGIYLTGFGISTLSCIAAGLLPARAASQMTPIEIIRMDS